MSEHDEFSGLDGVILGADAQAGALDAPPPAAEASAGGALVVTAGPDYLGEATGMVGMFAGFLCGMVPEAERIWTPEAKERTAQAMAPVMAKYGVSVGGGIPCELVLAVTAGPLLWQSARLVSAKIAQAKREAEAARTVDGETRIIPQAGVPGAPDPAGAGPQVHDQVRLYAGAGG